MSELKDFDFELPSERIAQAPLSERDQSRLLVVNRATGELAHKRFGDLPALLRASDLLVVNDSRVIPARLLGRKARTGGRIELLLVRPSGSERTSAALTHSASAFEWICMGQASKPIRRGETIELDPNLDAVVLDPIGEGQYRVRFHSPTPLPLSELLQRVGKVPLPPYIEREATEDDRLRYQAVYASESGSVAAPTAGLHFTFRLLEKLKSVGVRCVPLTLDVGPGTFLPVRSEKLEGHTMHAERFWIPEATAQVVNETKRAGGRVVAVGTTVVRALESATAQETGKVRSGEAETALFIRPGFHFRQVDALLTNFHLPKSTLLILACTFGGRDLVLRAYGEALLRGYRFFSYGDAMLIF